MSQLPLDPSTLATIERLIAATGITKAAALAELAQPAFRLRPAAGNTSDVVIGGSRFGGSPDVPRTFEWPTFKGHPLTFLAQIDLSWLPPSLLPPHGWLLFFYDEKEFSWGLKEDERESFRVIFVEGKREDLHRHAHPRLSEGLGPYRVCQLDLQHVVCLSDAYDFVAFEVLKDGGDLTADDDRTESYYDLRAALLTGSPTALETGTAPDEYTCHVLLGHPTIVQSDMRETGLLFPTDESGAPADDHKRVATPKPEDWQLLLQLDSDKDGPGWMWGDMGYLYFWITKEDLKNQRFDRCWIALQCY